MSRLIDADVLLEHIKKLECHAENEKYEKGMNDFLQFYFPQIIDEQPTAFDTEKVVEQLEEKRNNYQDEMEQCIFKALPCHDSLEGKIIGINNAIDIVKKGGVE